MVNWKRTTGSKEASWEATNLMSGGNAENPHKGCGDGNESRE